MGHGSGPTLPDDSGMMGALEGVSGSTILAGAVSELTLRLAIASIRSAGGRFDCSAGKLIVGESAWLGYDPALLRLDSLPPPIRLPRPPGSWGLAFLARWTVHSIHLLGFQVVPNKILHLKTSDRLQ